MNAFAAKLTAAVHDVVGEASVEAAERRWEKVQLRPWLGWLLVALMRQLNLDLQRNGSRAIDSLVFTSRLLSLGRCGLPEVRVRELLPNAHAIQQGIRDLHVAGLLPQRSENRFRLAPVFERLLPALAVADFESRENQARWAAHLGDFEFVAGHKRGDEARNARRDWFVAMLADLKRAAAAIQPLESILSAEAFLQTCAKIIDGSIAPATGVAIQRLQAHPEVPICDAVVRLVGRMDPGRDYPFAMYEAAQYLLRHGIQREKAVAGLLAFARVRRLQGREGNPYSGRFALLALEFAPEHAMELLRLALRSKTPAARRLVAAMLAGLSRPWTLRELLLALDAQADQGSVSELLDALDVLAMRRHWTLQSGGCGTIRLPRTRFRATVGRRLLSSLLHLGLRSKSSSSGIGSLGLASTAVPGAPSAGREGVETRHDTSDTTSCYFLRSTKKKKGSRRHTCHCPSEVDEILSAVALKAVVEPKASSAAPSLNSNRSTAPAAAPPGVHLERLG